MNHYDHYDGSQSQCSNQRMLESLEAGDYNWRLRPENKAIFSLQPALKEYCHKLFSFREWKLKNQTFPLPKRKYDLPSIWNTLSRIQSWRLPLELMHWLMIKTISKVISLWIPCIMAQRFAQNLKYRCILWHICGQDLLAPSVRVVRWIDFLGSSWVPVTYLMLLLLFLKYLP